MQIFLLNLNLTIFQKDGPNMPYVRRKYRSCKKCGIIGGLFYAQKRKNRPTTLNIHDVCQLCKRQDVADSYYRCYDSKTAVAKSRAYRLRNTQLVNLRRRKKRASTAKQSVNYTENIFLLEVL